MGQIAVKHEVLLETMDCITCGVTFGIPKTMHDTARRVGGFWCCPNGHSQGWEKGTENTKIKNLERELELEKSRKQSALERANALQIRADDLERKAKMALKRAKAGVCPCCNRTFKQLVRHMKTKHPEHAA